jgi:hypothetical protein
MAEISRRLRVRSPRPRSCSTGPACTPFLPRYRLDAGRRTVTSPPWSALLPSRSVHISAPARSARTLSGSSVQTGGRGTGSRGEICPTLAARQTPLPKTASDSTTASRTQVSEWASTSWSSFSRNCSPGARRGHRRAEGRSRHRAGGQSSPSPDGPTDGSGAAPQVRAAGPLRDPLLGGFGRRSARRLLRGQHDELLDAAEKEEWLGPCEVGLTDFSPRLMSASVSASSENTLQERARLARPGHPQVVPSTRRRDVQQRPFLADLRVMLHGILGRRREEVRIREL